MEDHEQTRSVQDLLGQRVGEHLQRANRQTARIGIVLRQFVLALGVELGGPRLIRWRDALHPV